MTRLLPVLLILACATETAPPPAPPARDAAADREAIMAADRAFADSTYARGLDGWMSYYTADAVRLRLGEPAAQGTEAVRQFDAPIFADTAIVLVWTPVDAGTFADGSHGFSTGKGAMVRRATPTDTVWQGQYVTIWRRGDDGRWMVILDTGS
jgi:ketosteroid isomerase-like protein